jgi:sarcosine oxidase subunit beta
LSKFRWEYWPENIKEVALQTSDVIVVGAGSVGTPTAMALGELGFKTRVIDMHPSPGQGENKHAIGGIRATHSDPVKILTCRRSLEIFASWEKQYGDNIEWLKGGYVFPVYRKSDETMLKKLLPVQNKYGLNIDYLGPEEIQQVVPGINPRGLRGGTFSPDDGSISPLLAVNAFYRRAVELGVAFHFKERVRRIRVNEDSVVGVETEQSEYSAPIVVDTAGPFSTELGRTVGIDLPVAPDSHEGAVTEPVRSFFKCMVVDIRPGPGSKNFYFYQNLHGQVIFCITPDPPIIGTDKGETSIFLPNRQGGNFHISAAGECPHRAPASTAKKFKSSPNLARALPDDPGRRTAGGMEPPDSRFAACHGDVRPGVDAGTGYRGSGCPHDRGSKHR